MIRLYRSDGMTLLEIMLVLAIGTSVTLLGIKQYQQYKMQGSVSQVGYLVDSLLQGMSDYYFANCKASFPSSNAVLSMDFTTAPQSSFLPSSATFVLAHLPSIVSSVSTRYSQTVTAAGRSAIGCSSYQTMNGQTICQWMASSPMPTTQAKVILWRAQVIIGIRDTTQTLMYKGFLNADCALNTLPAAGVAAVCPLTPITTGTPGYLLWQRLPSFASPALASSLRDSIYSTVLFTRQYTNDPMEDLYNDGSYISSSTSSNYVCGG